MCFILWGNNDTKITAEYFNGFNSKFIFHFTSLLFRPPLGGKTIYATRKIRSAVPRVNVADKKEEVCEVKSPTFEMTRTPTGNIGVKVQIQDDDTLGRCLF